MKDTMSHTSVLDACATSGMKMLFGPDTKRADTEIGTFENQTEAVEAAIKLGKDIAEKLKTKL